MSAPFHALAAGIHPAFYIQDAEPVESGTVRLTANVLWIDTTNGFKRIKRRNATNDGWETWGYIGNPPHRTVSATGSMVDDDEMVYLDPTSASFNFNLIAIASRTNKRPLKFKNIANPDTSANTVTFVPNGVETFGGVAIVQPGESGELSIFDNDSWERT